MRLMEMKTFVVLVRNRHFGRTAQELKTTQPAISARLVTLEQEFGCRLVDRSNGGFKLTPEGSRVLELAQQVLERVDNLKSELNAPSLESTTVIRIGAIDSISSTWMPGLIESLHEDMPRLKIELTIESTNRLVEGMNHGEFDLMFGLDPAIGVGFRTFVSCVLRMAWAGAPTLIDSRRVYTPEDLARMPIITFPRNTPPYRHIAPYFEEERLLATELTSSNSMFAIIRLLMDGFGIAALPAVTIEHELNAGSLCELRVSKRLSPMPIIGTYQTSTHQEVIRHVVNAARASARAYFEQRDPAAIWPD